MWGGGRSLSGSELFQGVIEPDHSAWFDVKPSKILMIHLNGTVKIEYYALTA
jgi:hypothetical protein